MKTEVGFGQGENPRIGPSMASLSSRIWLGSGARSKVRAVLYRGVSVPMSLGLIQCGGAKTTMYGWLD